MDINILVQRLQHGESELAVNQAGEQYQINRPPTALHLQAARAIMAQAQEINQLSMAVFNLQKQLETIINYESLQKSNAPTEASSSN